MNVFPEPEDLSFDKVGIKGKIFPTIELSKDVEFVLIKTESGHETEIIEHESTFSYYVLEGNGYFEIEGVRSSCKNGDLVVIPAGKKFTYKGNLKLLLVVAPPWREEQEETLN